MGGRPLFRLPGGSPNLGLVPITVETWGKADDWMPLLFGSFPQSSSRHDTSARPFIRSSSAVFSNVAKWHWNARRGHGKRYISRKKFREILCFGNACKSNSFVKYTDTSVLCNSWCVCVQVKCEMLTYMIDVYLSLVHELDEAFDVDVLDIFHYEYGILLFVLRQYGVEVRAAGRQHDLVRLDRLTLAGEHDVAKRLPLE